MCDCIDLKKVEARNSQQYSKPKISYIDQCFEGHCCSAVGDIHSAFRPDAEISGDSFQEDSGHLLLVQAELTLTYFRQLHNGK